MRQQALEFEERPIDSALLERMGRIARGLPGHVVSVGSDETAVDEPPESGPILRVDGVVAGEVLAQLEAS
jgi:hypothetical protein